MRSRAAVAYMSKLMPVPEMSSTWVERLQCEAIRRNSLMMTR